MLHHLKKKQRSDNGDMAKVDDFGLSATCFTGSVIVIFGISTQKGRCTLTSHTSPPVMAAAPPSPQGLAINLVKPLTHQWATVPGTVNRKNAHATARTCTFRRRRPERPKVHSIGQAKRHPW